MQLDLFETANIRLATPSRSNQKNAKPFPTIFRKVDGLFARIIGKITAFTVLQYINKTNNKPIGQIKYALL